MALERFEYTHPATGAATVVKLTAEEGKKLKLTRVGGKAQAKEAAPANKSRKPANKAATPQAKGADASDASDPGASE